ncbi:MAG: lysophospholipid acyltransferase family protein [Burkholderiales bacterium]
MKHIALIIRLVSLTIIILVSLLMVLLLFPITPRKQWAYVARKWAKIILLCVGVRIEVIGNKDDDYIKANTMVISNHISWLDIPVLYTLHFVNFIGRAEIRKWPLLNLLVKSGGTIFIARDKKRELVKLNQYISEKLINGATIGLFPEGKTGNGDQVLPFKSSLLEAALIAKSSLLPVVIKYYTKTGKQAQEVTYANDINLWQTIRNTLQLNGLHVKLILLEQFNAAQFSKREELSAYLFNQIQSTYSKND